MRNEGPMDQRHHRDACDNDCQSLAVSMTLGSATGRFHVDTNSHFHV